MSPTGSSSDYDWPPSPWKGPYVAPGGPVGPTPPIKPKYPEMRRLDANGVLHQVEAVDRAAFEHEINQQITTLLATEKEDSAEIHLKLADFYASRGLVFQQIESLGRALQLDGDHPNRTTLQQMANTLTSIGKFDYAAGYYRYLAETAPDVASKVACVDEQIDCLSKYATALRMQDAGKTALGGGR